MDEAFLLLFFCTIHLFKGKIFLIEKINQSAPLT